MDAAHVERNRDARVARRAWRPDVVLPALCLILGCVVRLIHPGDIEYKGDEQYTFDAVRGLKPGDPWPTFGMDSGAGGLKNPGFSVNAFVLLAKLFGATTPVELARTVQVTSIVALVSLWVFANVAVPRARREPWLWALALACVNPFEVLLERKIWSPSLFPLLCMMLLAGWWYRRTVVGAFAWGLAGAMAGQLEMAGGFFVALAFVVGTVIATRAKGVRIWAWLVGSALGAIPLLPWLGYMRDKLSHGLSPGSTEFYVKFSMAHHPLTTWMDQHPGQFWWVWLTGIAGVGLDYSYHADVWRLLREPLWGGKPTYLCGAVTALSSTTLLLLLARALARSPRLTARARRARRLFAGRPLPDPTWLVATIGWLWFGLLFTASPFFFHRHYLLATFPMQGLWIARMTLGPVAGSRRVTRALLGALVLFNAVLTTSVLIDIHAEGGVPHGDFGKSYAASHPAPPR